ncbi:MAG: Hsp33 family molecular chaperone HslO [Bdellovibrionaceae bacterium]|nr:Hsp33 family molecular chaperone HslO [Pseudobdellovibrionaceae bacterium]
MDILKKYMSHDNSVVFSFVDATMAVNESLKRVGCLPPAGIHLGQALLSCLLMQSIYGEKQKNKLSMQWSVDGSFGNLFVDMNDNGGIRGTITHPQFFGGKLNESLGEGVLQVIREGASVNQAHKHTGIVDSRGDVVSDTLGYLQQSEQRQCAMNVWIQFDTDSDELRLKAAWGYLVELLPMDDAFKRDMIAMFWEEKFKELGNMSKWNIDSNDPTTSMAQITLGTFGKEVSQKKVFFECTCNEERAQRALVFANQKDQDHHQDQAQVTCEYCGQVYDIELDKQA